MVETSSKEQGQEASVSQASMVSISLLTAMTTTWQLPQEVTLVLDPQLPAPSSPLETPATTPSTSPTPQLQPLAVVSTSELDVLRSMGRVLAEEPAQVL